MLDLINNLDTSLFLAINGVHSSLMDSVMVFVSAKFFWIPFYLIHPVHRPIIAHSPIRPV